jgi:hypothetical protein
MVDLVIPELIDAPAGLLKAIEADNAASEISITPSSILITLTYRSRPRSTSVSFVGYFFRYDGREYKIKTRSTIKKGGK